MLSNMQEYPKLDSKDVRVIGGRTQDGLEARLMVVQSPFGYRRMAEIIRPEHKQPCAAILYVHWYEPESHDSNRSQFVKEAKELARGGAVCLLIETLWSDPDFFYKRTQQDDQQNSIEEVVNLRRAMDLVLSQPDVDPERFAFVGHDFGGMYGVLAGSLDPRPSRYVIMAATPRFPDWYLYSPKLEGDARKEYIRQMSGINPVVHISKLSPASVLFQFGRDDPHVPRDRAEEFYNSAKKPREIRWYESGHGLDDMASADRKAWLGRQLKLDT